MISLVMLSRVASLLLFLALIVARQGLAAANRGELRVSLDGAPGMSARGSLHWRRGALRLAVSELRMGSDRRLTGRVHLSGPGARRLRSWAVGHLQVRWARGAGSLPRSSGRLLAVSRGSRSSLTGGAAIVRAMDGDLLVAAGSERGEPAVILAWATARGGALVAAHRRAPPEWSLAVKRRHAGRLLELELASAGRRPVLALRAIRDARGVAAELGLSVPVPLGSPPNPGARPDGPELALDLRLGLGPMPAAIGARASLPAPSPATLGTSATASRAWIQAEIPHRAVSGATVRAELRRTGSTDRSRLHAELRAGLGRAACDWVSGGGLLIRVRTLWRLPAGLVVEAGAARWSGPVAGAGATVGLPWIPTRGLDPRLRRPGQETGLVIDWQVAEVRVRLGLTTRQSRNAVPDSRFASRIDLVLPPRKRGS
jgi:hypothetical protein